MCASSRIKHYAQPFIWLPWDACSHPYVCLYCAKKLLHILQKSTRTRAKNIKKYKQKVGMLLQKRTDTRGVGISSMRKYIYIPPYNHTHRFHPHPPPANHTHSPQLSSILLTLHKFKVWMTIVESGWNVWVWLVGEVSRRWVRLVGVGRIYGCG